MTPSEKPRSHEELVLWRLTSIEDRIGRIEGRLFRGTDWKSFASSTAAVVAVTFSIIAHYR